MRIALVSDCYPPRMGGIETQVAGLAEQLRARGHDVRVLTVTAGPAERGLTRLNAAPMGPPVNPFARPALRPVLTGADVVHVHLGVWAPFAQMAADVATSTGTPTVITWHSLVATAPLTPALRPRWRRWVERGAIPSAVSTVAAAQLAGALGGAGLAGAVALAPNGIDLSRWTQGPIRVGTAATPQVASATRFTARKRVLGLLRMMAAVRAALPVERRPRLVVCGDGPLLRPLRALVAAGSWQDWVELPGRLSAPELVEVYRGSNLYVAPARHEAFGTAALEAAAAGLPVMGYRGSGVRDIVHPRRVGTLAETDRGLVDAMVDALRAGGPLRSMTAARRAHPPTDYGWPSAAEATVGLYRRAAEGE